MSATTAADVTATGAGSGDQAAREVGAAVLLRVYWHLKIAELILGGMKPREANELCWQTYYFGGWLQRYTFAVIAADTAGRDHIDLASRAMYPAGGGYPPNALTPVPGKGPHKHWTTRCLTAGVAEDQQLLVMPWAELVQHDGPSPRARITEADAARLAWLCHMLWLLSTGAGDLLHCARVAHDRASGKPARKRQPVDPGWLAAELDAALTECWDAFRTADSGTGRPLWPLPLPTARPTADGGGEWLMRQREASRPRTDALRQAAVTTTPMHGRARGATKSPKRAPRRNRKRR